MSNILTEWYARSTHNKDGTITTVWTNVNTGMSGSTTSIPFRWSSVFKEELDKIKKMLDRHFNWSEDAVSTHRIPALVPRSSRRYDKSHPFSRPVPKTQLLHKGR